MCHLQVNASTSAMKYNLARWNVKSLPYFFVFNGGALVSEFSCNLSSISRLRNALAGLRTTSAIVEHVSEHSQLSTAS
jgi:hypothetical protein